MSAPFDDLRYSAINAKISATLARSGRDMNKMSEPLKRRLTACARTLDAEALELEQVLAEAWAEFGERRRAP